MPALTRVGKKWKVTERQRVYVCVYMFFHVSILIRIDFQVLQKKSGLSYKEILV